MLTLDALTKSYDTFRMGPLDLSVGREVVAVLGPSGCGKTTLLSVVAGLVEPEDGSVVLDGVPLHDIPLEARGTACVFQDNAVFPHLTARENVAYAAADASLVTELAAALEITGVLDQRAGTLSGGERRRVEVARALAARPRALLLDEPTTGLDAPIKRRLRLQLRDLLQTLDIPVLYVTHDQDEAAVVADRIAVMDDGTVHQVGRPEAIFHRPASPFVATFTGNPNVFAARVASRNGTDAAPADAARTPLDWSGRRLHASRNGFAPDAAVWLCIRPEEIHLEPPSALSGDAPGANTFDASITRRSYEGGLHVLTLRLDDEGPVVEARMLHSAARQIDLDARDRIRLRLPEDAVHLMQRDADV